MFAGSPIRMFAPPKRADREFLDTPGQDPLELAGLLADIRRTNSRFGGRRLILRALRRLTPAIAGRPITLLDVATASADIPCAVAGWSRARGVPIRVVALDLSDAVLSLARQAVAAYPEITLLRGNALSLPFPDGAFDVVICGLALHHFTFDESARVLREIDRVARHAFVVNDIERSWAAYLGAWLDTRILSRNRLARHDGPLSVLRSFTRHEFRDMVRAAGLRGVGVTTHPVFRIVIARWPTAGNGEPFDSLALAQGRQGTGNG